MILEINPLISIITDITVTAHGGSIILPADTVAPVVSAPVDLAIQFTNGTAGLFHTALTTWLSSASAIDNKDGALAVSNNLNTFSDPFTPASYTITFSATDAAGNTGIAQTLITVTEAIDIVVPIVTAPVDTGFQFANGGAGVPHSELAALFNTATANDDIDGAITPTSNLASLPDPLTEGNYEVTFTAMDATGNIGTDTVVISVTETGAIDSTPPAVTAPANSTFEFAIGGAGIAHSALNNLLATASAFDGVDGAITPTNNLATFADPLPEGQHVITFSATDAANNTGTATVTITVNEALDATNPVVTAPANNSFEFALGGAGLAHSALTVFLATATALDNIDGPITPTNNIDTLANPLPAGNHLITITAVDAAGNTGTDTVVVNVFEAADITAPVVTAPSNTSFEFAFDGTGLAHSELTTFLDGASALDNADGAITPTHNLGIFANPLPEGVYLITFSATDAAGNIGTDTVSLTVAEAADNVDPIVVAPANETREFVNGGAGLAHSELTALFNTATATDNVDGSITPTNNLATFVNPLPVGPHTITFTAIDAVGNVGTDTIVITVNEAAPINTAPVINDQNLNVEQQIDLVIPLGDLVDSDGDTLTYVVIGSSDITPLASNSITFNALGTGIQTLNVSVSDGKGGTDTSVITVNVTALLSQPLINSTVSNVNQNVEKIHTLGPATTGNGKTITYTISPADYPVSNNQITISANTGGSYVYTVTANDGDGPDVTANLTINVIASQVEPSLIDFVGWSLLFNTNNGEASLPHGINYGSIPNLLETMFLADGLNHTLSQGIIPSAAFMEGLGEPDTTNFISNSPAQAIVLSGHSSSAGLDPSAPPSWIDEAATAANAVTAAGKQIIWYEGWLHTNNAQWGGTNVKTNFDNLKAAHGGTVIKTYQCLDRLRVNNPEYFNTATTGYAVPTVELFADSVHGTFALYYMAAACVYRAVTGKLTTSMVYTVPDYYQMPSALKAAIDDAVDFVQDDAYPGITLQEYGTAYMELWASAGTDQGINSPNSESINYLNLGTNTDIALIDKSGNQTGIHFTIPSEIFGGSLDTQSADGENAGFLPDVLMTAVDFQNLEPMVVVLTGLTQDKEYSFKGTASRNGGAGRNQNWLIGGSNFEFEAGNNRDLGVSATFIADENGEAVLTFAANVSGGNGWVYLSGFILSSGTPITVYDTEILIENIEVL